MRIPRLIRKATGGRTRAGEAAGSRRTSGRPRRSVDPPPGGRVPLARKRSSDNPDVGQRHQGASRNPQASWRDSGWGDAPTRSGCMLRRGWRPRFCARPTAG